MELTRTFKAYPRGRTLRLTGNMNRQIAIDKGRYNYSKYDEYKN